MASSPPIAGPPAHRTPVLYLATWGLLAAFALGYLALLVLRPDLATGLTGGPFEGTPENNRGQRAMTRALAELNGVKQSVARLESEMADLRKALAAEELKARTLEARLTSVERRPPAVAPIAQSAPAAAEKRAAGPDTLGATTAVTQAATEERATRALREGRQAEAPRETSVLAQALPAQAAPPVQAGAAGPTVAPKAAEARPKGPPLGLWVGTGPSLDAVRLSWQLLQEGHKATLRSLEPRYVANGSDPASFQLIAGPIAAREDALKACERLRAQQQRCTVIPFGGQPL